MHSTGTTFFALSLSLVAACSKESAKPVIETAHLQGAPTPSAATSLSAVSIDASVASPATAQAAPAAVSGCSKLAWSGSDMPVAKGATLAGTVKAMREKNSDGAPVEFMLLTLDTPICDWKNRPLREVQVGEEKTPALFALNGKQVTLAFDEFFMARSEAVHMRAVVGVPSDASEKKGALARTGCSPLTWSSKEGTPSAKVAAARGTLSRAEGTLPNGRAEVYFVVKLDQPVCGSDGKAVREVQLTPLPVTEAEVAKLTKLDGKRVAISGEAEAAETSHDHLPVVVFGSAKGL